MKRILTTLFIILIYVNVFSQVDTAWTKSIGGSLDEVIGLTMLNNLGSPVASIDTSNDGYIYITTTTKSTNNYLNLNYGEEDIWVIKMNFQGDTVWTKVIGGTSFDRPHKVLGLSDGGCIIVGRTSSTDIDFTGGHGSEDGFLIRLNSNGSLNWKKLYGGSNSDFLYDIAKTSDGNFIVCGESGSLDGDLLSAGTGGFAWIMKVNSSNGTKIWSKTYLGPNSSSPDFLENFYKIIELSDGTGFVAAGYTTPSFADPNSDDIYYQKISPTGTSIWTKKVGSTNGGEGIGAIVDAGNGEFYITGKLTGATGADVTCGYYGGSGDVWLLKFDNTGTKTWDKHYGGTNYEFAFDMKKDDFGNLYISGFTRSTDNDASGVFYGNMDFWLIKTNSNGDTIWTKRSGGSMNDVAMGLTLVGQNSIVMVGKTLSNDLCVHGNNGGQDLWVVKYDGTSTVSLIEMEKSNEIAIFPNPSKNEITVKQKNNLIFSEYGVFNSMGNLIYKSSFQSQNKIDISGLNSGVYFIKVYNQDKVSTMKFIKL